MGSNPARGHRDAVSGAAFARRRGRLALGRRWRRLLVQPVYPARGQAGGGFTPAQAEGQRHGHLPWFDVPGRRTAGEVVAFGHWSTLGWLDRPDLISLDTGCVWGGCLSAVRLGADGHQRELIQVRCPQAQKPGGRA